MRHAENARSLGKILAAIPILLACVSTAGAQQADRWTFPEVGELDLEVVSGNVEIRPVEGTRWIVTLRRDLERGAVDGDVRVEGGTLVIRERWSAGTSTGRVEWLVGVPASAEPTLELRTTSGDVAVRDLKARASFGSASGSVVLEDVELAGPGRFVSASGDLSIELPELPRFDLEARSASGDVRLSVGRWGGDFTLVLTARADHGEIDSPFPPTSERTFERGTNPYVERIVRRGSGSPRIVLHSASGAVTVEEGSDRASLELAPIPEYRRFSDCDASPPPEGPCRITVGPAVEKVERELADRSAAVWLEGPDRLTIAYVAPTARAVDVVGGVQLPMSRIEGTPYWILSLRMPGADRARMALEFWVETEAGLVRDTTSLVEFRAPHAPPAVPGATRVTGTTRTDSLWSEHLGEWRKLTWYVPAGRLSEDPLPVVYLADGGNVSSYATVVDTLVRTGALPPVALVGVWPARAAGAIRSIADDPRAIEYLEGVASAAGRDSAAVERRHRGHLRFFTEEVPRWAESTLGVSAERADRAVQGASNAGAFALRLGRDYGDLYGAVIAFSHSGGTGSVGADPETIPVHFLAVGRLEQDRLKEGLRDLADRLDERGVPVRLEIYPSGHDPLVWEELFPEAVAWWRAGSTRSAHEGTDSAPTDPVALDPVLLPLPAATIEVNGIPTLALVDSGAGLTVVSDSIAALAGLSGGASARARGAGGERAASIHEGVTVTVGETVLSDRRVVAIDLSEVAEAVGRPVGAILGADVFSTHVVDLDYPGRRMALHDPSSWSYRGSGRVLALERRGDQWAVPARIEDLPPTLVDLDTGSDETITVYAAYAERHGLLGNRRLATHVQGGVGGVRRIRVGTLDRLEIGPVVLYDVPAAFDPGDVGALADRTEGGNLGGGVLSRFRVVFDVPGGRLVLEPAEDPGPFRKDRSGLQTRWKGDHLEVVHVVPGSPGDEAGWETGDRIRAIDGVTVGPAERAALRGWKYGPSGTPVVLVDQTGRERTLVLEDYY